MPYFADTWHLLTLLPKCHGRMTGGQQQPGHHKERTRNRTGPWGRSAQIFQKCSKELLIAMNFQPVTSRTQIKLKREGGIWKGEAEYMPRSPVSFKPSIFFF